MKIIVCLNIVAIVLLLFIPLLTPIRKMSTDAALNSIEQEYLRSDITKEERDRYDFYAMWIRGNQRSCLELLSQTTTILLIVVILMTINTILFYKQRNSKNYKASQVSNMPLNPDSDSHRE